MYFIIVVLTHMTSLLCSCPNTPNKYFRLCSFPDAHDPTLIFFSEHTLHDYIAADRSHMNVLRSIRAHTEQVYLNDEQICTCCCLSRRLLKHLIN